MAPATQTIGHASRLPAFWIRRSVTLLLSPVGLLLISVTRLMIVADYNSTTATTIASSGGYVNTILGTVVPLVPLFLPYLAIVLLVFRRFILGFMAFGAALLISPTRLAPLTAFSRLASDWNNTVALVEHNLALSIAVFVFIVLFDLVAFRHTLGRLSLVAITLTLISVAFLLPYILYVYPIPRTGNYYAEFMRQPWLSAERIEVSSGISVVGYTLTEDDNWTTFLNASTRRVEYFRTDAVLARKVCQVNSGLQAAPQSPLIPLLHTKPAELPPCWPPAYKQASPAQQERSETSVHRVSTSSTRFARLKSVPALNVCGSGAIIVTLSVELHGAPAGFRILIDGTTDMSPGAVRFDPTGAHDSFSFIFTDPASPVLRRTVAVQWRSPFGIPSHLERISVEARYVESSEGC